MDSDLLRKLAARYGVDTTFTAKTEGDHGVEHDALLAVLRAHGADVSDDNALRQELLLCERKHWQEIIDPVLVVREETTPIRCQVRVLEESARQQLQWQLKEESGSVHAGKVLPAQLEVQERKEVDGRLYTSFSLDLPLSLNTGYHTLHLTLQDNDGGNRSVSIKIIITPHECFHAPGLLDGRIWGISCALPTLRSRRNWGCGDFTDLKNLLSWGAENGAGTIAVSALHPSPSFDSLSESLPSSRFHLGLVFLDLEAVDDFRESEEARQAYQEPAFQVQLANLREQDVIEYQKIVQVKITVVELLWKHFLHDHLNPETERGRVFRQFQESGGERLWAYGLFEALQAHFAAEKGGPASWPSWPEPFLDRRSPEVAEFAKENQYRVELFQYIQWQAGLQLAGIGRRSLELGLKLGLLQPLPLSVAADGFETWYETGLYALDITSTAGAADGFRGWSDREGPPVIPFRAAFSGYDSFIAMLRMNMQHVGALSLKDIEGLEQLCWRPVDNPGSIGISVRYPLQDLLGIIALESRRNRCMVVADCNCRLSDAFRNTLEEHGMILTQRGCFAKDEKGEWLSPQQYPVNRLISASNYDPPSLSDLWRGKDIAMRSALGLFVDQSWYEQEIVARAADRAQLLLALRREKLLPEIYDVDPSTIPQMTLALADSIQQYLARAPAKIFLLQIADLLGPGKEEISAEATHTLPDRGKKPLEYLESMHQDDRFHILFAALCREREVGVIKPSALITDRRRSKVATIPRAFYRLQLSKEFSFLSAAGLVPYLKALGISHLYASPYLKARPGSTHGYDIIDHCALNPEIGSREDYEVFVAALDRQGLAQILDMVPNHMGVGSDNKWWVDVLENGQVSRFAGYFDVNWEPQQEELKGRVLLPILGDYYGAVLEKGELCLVFEGDRGAFFISYYEQRFPVAPRTYSFILEHDIERLENRIGGQHSGFLELQNLIASFNNLPDRHQTDPDIIKTRHRNKEVLKRLLARLCREDSDIASFVEENVILFNGEKGRKESFDLLHQLLSIQAYRLAYWRVAADEVNYRRFFDINDLAGVRIESKEVFDNTHNFVLDLIATGKVDGLRIDHPDGLYDPAQYCRRLQAAVSGEPLEGFEKHSPKLPLYMVLEKVLAESEQLPLEWPVHGTTGYDFAADLNGIFVDVKATRAMTGTYHRFIGAEIDFDRLVYDCKKLIMKSAMSGELTVLTDELYRLARGNRYTQDFTHNSLRKALAEIIAWFPVYRTYIASVIVSAHDKNYIDGAVYQAKSKQLTEDVDIYEFIRRILLMDMEKENTTFHASILHFIMKLQQYTGPVMAKGMEDTSFYIYNRLLSLNEVGGCPKRFGISVKTFHKANHDRWKNWPHAMLSSSTHDSKRSEDVRARINVLSEMVGEWSEALETWSKGNQNLKSKINGLDAPSKNDEYALYQNLLGVWPLEGLDPVAMEAFAERMENYMQKVIRESKIQTSWMNPHEEYEKAMSAFVRRLLDLDNTWFIESFVALQKTIAWFGMLNSLSQTLLKLVSPGVPDIYQGNELWQFCLVDPDNRRPVDFDLRKRLLAGLEENIKSETDTLKQQLRNLLDTMEDGSVKMYLTWRILQYRKEHKDIFDRGAYRPLYASGTNARHICAFIRSYEGRAVMAAAPRLMVQLLGKKEGHFPLGLEVWGDTAIVMPDGLRGCSWKNLLTGETVSADGVDRTFLSVSTLFASFPVALLEKE